RLRFDPGAAGGAVPLGGLIVTAVGNDVHDDLLSVAIGWGVWANPRCQSSRRMDVASGATRRRLPLALCAAGRGALWFVGGWTVHVGYGDAEQAIVDGELRLSTFMSNIGAAQIGRAWGRAVVECDGVECS